MSQINKREQRRRARRRRTRVVFLSGMLTGVVVTLALGRLVSAGGAHAETAEADIISDIEEVYAAEQGDYDTEWAWLCENEYLFPEGKVEQSEGNAGLVHYLYKYGTGDYSADPDISFTDAERKADIPLLLQWDGRWGYDAYGDNTIGISGCGPTCVSMVVLGLTGDEDATPRELARYAMENDLYMYGTGTKWDFILSAAGAYGVYGYELDPDESSIIQKLSEGNPVVLNVGAGHFTFSGHFIVATGLENGRLRINDPNSIENSERLWDYQEIADEVRAAWVFER